MESLRADILSIGIEDAYLVLSRIVRLFKRMKHSDNLPSHDRVLKLLLNSILLVCSTALF